jgi:cytoskeletal protein RodZ
VEEAAQSSAIDSAQTEEAQAVETPPEETIPEVPSAAIETADQPPAGIIGRLAAFLPRFSGRNLQPQEPGDEEPAYVESNARDFNPLPPEAAGPEKSSREIFAEIGARLRTRREMLSLTFEEVERHTRVRAVFLQQLERGALEDLPSPVQTRGILANYASFLDLDADTILLRFADGLQARHRERLPEKPKRSRSHMTVNTSLPPLRSFIASDLIFGGGMAIMLLLFAVWGISRVMAVRSTLRPQPTSRPISVVLAGLPSATPAQEVTLIPAQDTPLVPAPAASGTVESPTFGANLHVQVNLVAVERTYMRVTVDGKVQFDGRVTPGSAYPFEAERQIDVLVGNGAAIRVTYNGRELGFMGSFGEVVERVYTVQGPVTPTSTQPSTPTPKPAITPTPSQIPTSTPTPTAGG